jgi:hypothetical protein
MDFWNDRGWEPKKEEITEVTETEQIPSEDEEKAEEKSAASEEENA